MESHKKFFIRKALGAMDLDNRHAPMHPGEPKRHRCHPQPDSRSSKSRGEPKFRFATSIMIYIPPRLCGRFFWFGGRKRDAESSFAFTCLVASLTRASKQGEHIEPPYQGLQRVVFVMFLSHCLQVVMVFGLGREDWRECLCFQRVCREAGSLGIFHMTNMIMSWLCHLAYTHHSKH